MTEQEFADVVAWLREVPEGFKIHPFAESAANWLEADAAEIARLRDENDAYRREREEREDLRKVLDAAIRKGRTDK